MSNTYDEGPQERNDRSECSIRWHCICLALTLHCGTWWRFGRVDAFRPKGHGFDSRSSRHVGTLGKFLTHSWLWHIGVKFWHSIHGMSGAPLCNRNRIRIRKLEISTAPTKANSREPAYSQALVQNKTDRQRTLVCCWKEEHFETA